MRGLVTINLCDSAKFEDPIFIGNGNTKGNVKCTKQCDLFGWLLVTEGHRHTTSSYSSLTETTRLSCTVIKMELSVESRRY